MLIKKTRLFINYLKEERWINEMALQGLYLVNYKFGRYTFEKGKPGEYEYRMELLEDNGEEAEEYLNFMKESGIEPIVISFNWVYFRKKTTDEPFVIYTDYDSRKKHLQRVISMLLLIMLANLVVAILNTSFITTPSLSSYVSILNWFAVIVLTIVILQYVKNMRELKRNNE